MKGHELAEGRGRVGVDPGTDEAPPRLWVEGGGKRMTRDLTELSSADLKAPCDRHASVTVAWSLHYDQWGPSTSVEVEMGSPVDAFALLGDIRRAMEWLHAKGPLA